MSPFRATLIFYPRMIRTVWHASRLARRGRYGRAEWERSSRDILAALERAGCRVEIEGMQHISSFDGPAVFTANHMSTAETFLLPAVIDPVKPLTFVVKPSLLEYPVFGHIMRSRAPIVVSRDNPRADLITVLEEGRRRLANGISIVLFPQTTRITGFDRTMFNTLAVKLAKASGVPVVPVALRTDAWGNGSLIKDFGRIDPRIPLRIVFAPPMGITGNGKREHERILAFIEEHLRRWGL
ncbi:MAG: lysophospholipid acyltransferase family protein [Bacteroidota bacterium]|nr:lysophospholipid acyltransferase family protein [Bacteroidota bacterium]